MHPAPSLAESFPKHPQQEDRNQYVPHQQPPPPGEHSHHRHGHRESIDHKIESPAEASTPLRKDTGSSLSTVASDATILTSASADTNGSAYSVESSQSIFSIKDGSEISGNRRTSRRRTGPLSAQQREKAALIRKLGACIDCRRRRVACHPNHHNMTWEDAMRKYRSTSPLQELAPLAGRPLSPAPSQIRTALNFDSQDMDIDSTPTAQSPSTRLPLVDTRIRTPLPSGPRLERVSLPPLAAAPPLLSAMPSTDSVRSELESAASRVVSSSYHRYSTVYAILIHWQDETQPNVLNAISELADVFGKQYSYNCDVIRIPASSESCANPWRWLSRIVNDFTERNDSRDVLKVVYYSGYSFLDGNRETVLANSRDRLRASTIRWSGIQQIIEEACSDTLIIMDCPYFPSSRMVRQKGVLELIAASASEEHYELLDRSSFTRGLADHLRSRALQRSNVPLSAADLHSRLLSIYPKMTRNENPRKDQFSQFASPLHMQMSGNPKLPSITLSPPKAAPGLWSPTSPPSSQISLSFRLTDELMSVESWVEWLRMMPEGIKEVKVDGPYMFR